MKELYRYVWKVSGRQQIVLTILAVALFLLDLAPLELQRRMVNGAVAGLDFRLIGMMAGLYVVAALTQGGIKLLLNIYRASVSEAATRRLRLETSPVTVAAAAPGEGSEEGGVAISIIVSEVEAVGGFVGNSFSEPALNGGILLSVLGYMLYIEPWMALVAIALICPQLLFIPIMQTAINRRTKQRIETLRALSIGIVKEAADRAPALAEKTFGHRVGDIYRLNMQIFRRKFGMNFLMNLFYHLGVAGILAIGGWLVLHGQTEIGTVVAFISGLNRMNDPWGDLVNFFRDLTNAGVKYRMIVEAIERSPAKRET